MATQQFESAKKLILYLTQKNCVSPESDIKGVMPGKYNALVWEPKGKYDALAREPEGCFCPE